MKNILIGLFAITVFSLCPASSLAAVWNVDSGGLVYDYNDNFFAFTVSGEDTVTDVDIILSIAHTAVGDLRITLTHDNTPFQAVLFNGWGGNDDNLQDTHLDDEAETSIQDGSPPYPGTYHPYNPFSDLSVFDGTNPNTTWRLLVDDQSTQDAGYLYRAGDTPLPWAGMVGTKLIINSAPIPIPSAVWLLGSGIIRLVGIRRKIKY